MTDSMARGCFLVIEGKQTSADIFRVIERDKLEMEVNGLMCVPSLHYTVYAYDVEENGLPNPVPAVTPQTRKASHGMLCS